MPDLMAKCQALHLLNIHQEPFTRGFLEALVSGLAEVGRMPGGANEVVNKMSRVCRSLPATART